MKLQEPLQLLHELGFELDEYHTGNYKDRPIRYIEEIGLFQLGDNDFDRWANSEDLDFPIWLAKGQRQLKRWVENDV